MMTVGQALFFAVIFGVILCIVAGLIFYNVGYKHGESLTDSSMLYARIAELEPHEVVQALVTLHDARTDEFVETKKYDTAYQAVSAVSQYSMDYNLRLKLQLRSGEYVAFDLINTSV